MYEVHNIRGIESYTFVYGTEVKHLFQDAIERNSVLDMTLLAHIVIHNGKLYKNRT